MSFKSGLLGPDIYSESQSITHASSWERWEGHNLIPLPVAALDTCLFNQS